METYKKIGGNRPYPLGVIEYTRLPARQQADLLKYGANAAGFINPGVVIPRKTADAGLSGCFAGYFIRLDEYESRDGQLMRLTGFPGDPDVCPPCPVPPPCPPGPGPGPDPEDCGCDGDWCDPTFKVSPSCPVTDGFSVAYVAANDLVDPDFNHGTIQLETIEGATPVTF